MKKSRSPQEKKLLSYKKDCRNTYGEGSYSRHAIAAHKARDHRAYRRQINQILTGNEIHDVDLLEEVDVEAKSVAESSWRKYPDEPLAKVLESKLERREYKEINKNFENKLDEFKTCIEQGLWAAIKNVKPALLIVKMYNSSFQSEQFDVQRTKLDELFSFAREKQFHIIDLLREFKRDSSYAFLEIRSENIKTYIEGTLSNKIFEELIQMKGEREILWKLISSFHMDLNKLLKKLNPSFIVLAGVNTNNCIRTAAIDAHQRDYRVQIISDCVVSPDARHHDPSLNSLGKGIARVVNLTKFQEEFNAGVAA